MVPSGLQQEVVLTLTLTVVRLPSKLALLVLPLALLAFAVEVVENAAVQFRLQRRIRNTKDRLVMCPLGLATQSLQNRVTWNYALETQHQMLQERSRSLLGQVGQLTSMPVKVQE
jgi:hypothetical protein